MERLVLVERHLQHRADRPRSTSFLFYNVRHEKAFAAQYFDKSTEHQRLRENIIFDATQKRQAKIAEWQNLRERYHTLMQSHHQRMHCDYVDVVVDWHRRRTEVRHSSSCLRCHYKNAASNLQVAVHEWPLPEDPVQSKIVVFELLVPAWFSQWRDAVTYLQHDILAAEYVVVSEPRSIHHLSHDPHLGNLFRGNSRIGLLSQIKPHVGTHRRGKELATVTKEQVCCSTGLSYLYFDRKIDCFVDDCRYTEKTLRACTYLLPPQASALNKFIWRPAKEPQGPPPNTVVASQAECPDHMSLAEYKDLASIPVGIDLQWWDIAAQLKAPTVNFQRIETILVILQCVYQAGPASNDGSAFRCGYRLLEEEKFCEVLLDGLKEALRRVRDNWESLYSLGMFVAITCRLLSLTRLENIRTGCIIYLAETRIVAMRWMKQLQDKYQAAGRTTDRIQFHERVAEAALICASSFDMDEIFQAQALESTDAASVLLQCSIIVNHARTVLEHHSESWIHFLRLRHQRLLRNVHPILADSQAALDDAVQKTCVTYQVGRGWHLSAGTAHWMASEFVPAKAHRASEMHLNLLTGELLVDGTPLDRLPKEYEKHACYQALFSNSVLEVIPTVTPGMSFASKNRYRGYALEFGMHESIPGSSPDLVLRATIESTSYILLPSRVFRSNIPNALVDNFFHWYDSSSRTVEFRPRSDPWNRNSSDQWILTNYGEDSVWQLHRCKDKAALAGLKSQTAQALASIFAPLAQPPQIHVLFLRATASLTIEFHGLNLGFSLLKNSSLLQSREFRGMFVDQDQSIGTLIGFRNKLVLRENAGSRRMILTVEGRVNLEHCPLEGNLPVFHDSPRASVDLAVVSGTHAFQVDHRLGRLVDNGSLESKLFLVYLHAITSFCLPDPLTRKTGTEQALSILNSAAVRSFSQLTQKNIDSLRFIAKLTPKRVFYPSNERVMQEVTWCPGLGFLSHHGSFYKSVRSIFDQARRSEIFYPDSTVQIPQMTDVDQDLLQRDCIRSSTFRVSGFGAEDFCSDEDMIYRPRKRNFGRRSTAHVVANQIIHVSQSLHWNAPSAEDLWALITKSSVVHGPEHMPMAPWCRYDARYIQDGMTFVSQNWPWIQRALGEKALLRLNKYAIMMWLCTLGCSDLSKSILGILVWFCNSSKAMESAPSQQSFQIDSGTDVRPFLRGIVSANLLSFHASPESDLVKGKHESRKDFGARQQVDFQSNRDKAINFLVTKYNAQWPCREPIVPEDHGSTRIFSYVDQTQMSTAVQARFSRCFHNLQLYQYIERIANKVASLQTVEVVPSERLFSLICSLASPIGYISWATLFYCPAPYFGRLADLSPSLSRQANGAQFHRLRAFLNNLKGRMSGSQHQIEYLEGLEDSVTALESSHRASCANTPSLVALFKQRECYAEHMSRMQSDLIAAVTYSNDATLHRQALAEVVGQSPRLGTEFFLRQLGKPFWGNLNDAWKECIITYALTLTASQRIERLVEATVAGKTANAVKEWENAGHLNWNPLEHPESLLLEVESDIMIRDVQEAIAGKMREPPHGNNSSMQLNMGEGKSSVIAPIVVADLADGSRLLRVIVAKPQSRQMSQMLIAKLGGLLNRRVYYMPFSRSLRINSTNAEAIDAMCRECMAGGGVLLVQPEHLLSFQLMAIERSICGEAAAGNALLETQRFFENHARDIVDESDENFNVKYELIYTMGVQQQLEYCPDRWNCIAEILALVKMIGPEIAKALPLSIQIKDAPHGSFPLTRILRKDAATMLIEQIARHICDVGLLGFPISSQSDATKAAVFTYISKPDLSLDDILAVENDDIAGFWVESLRPKLLLLRGLLAGKILVFALHRKRWSVNYGLDANRTPATKLAVPYRAKDQPSSRSDFSHPDVTILLTYLSYYYGYLQDDDIYLAFEQLQASDHRDVEYQDWVKDILDLRPSFRHLQGINLKDRPTCTSALFPALRKSKNVIDFFLAHVVFPKELRIFPHKLCASGWDIGRIKKNPTTAFSGTCDAYPLLPLGMSYLSLPKQKHTNALVLDHLLRPENFVATVSAEVSGRNIRCRFAAFHSDEFEYHVFWSTSTSHTRCWCSGFRIE